MHARSTLRSLFAAATLACTLAAALVSAPLLGQTSAGHGGRAAVFVPEATTAGSWDGTWAYSSSAMKMALWMRTKRGKTEVKLKYESGQSPVVFQTDWSGDASFYSAERASTFAMHMSKIDPDRMEGSWSWDMPLGKSVRIEKGDFSIFRALDGRLLAFEFKTYELSTVRRGEPTRATEPPVWTFRKVSKREALWEEIPF